MKFQKMIAGVAALAALTSLSACGSDDKAELADDWDSIVAAAKKEGSLTFYSSSGTVPTTALVEAFTKKYGIKVEVVQAADSELVTKVETEQNIKKGLADVLQVSDATWVKNNPQVAVKIEGSAIDDEAYDADTNAPEGTFAATAAFIPVIAWNPKEYPTGLKGIEDILNPALGNGKIGLQDPVVSPSIVAYYLDLEEQFGDDFLTKLAAQKPKLYATATAINQAIVSGEIAATPYSTPPVEEKASGADIDWTTPARPFGVRFRTAALKNAPHPNAAQVFVNFLISQEGQTAFTDPRYGTPRSDIPGAVAPYSELSLLDEYPAQDVVDDFRARFKKT